MSLTGTERSSLIAAIAQPSPGRKLADVINLMDDGAYTVSYSISAEVTNVITVTVTVKTIDNRALDNRVCLDFLLISSTSTFALNAADYTIAATTGVVAELIADKVLRVVTSATGVAVLTFSIATAATSFLAACLPGGNMSVSGAITHV
jgi:hypothetical protein